MLLYPALSFIAFFIPQGALKGHGDGKTIVIVERWLTMNIRHFYWKYYLEKKGYNVYLANFPLRQGNFKESSEQLAKYIERHNLENITLVGISCGGLTAFDYLQNYGGWARVDKFISIGAPFQGTWMAFFISFAYSGRELFPFSSYIKLLKSYKPLNPEKIYCFRAQFDEMVPNGAVLPGAHPVTLKIFGHNNLHIRIAATYREIAKIAGD